MVSCFTTEKWTSFFLSFSESELQF